MKLRKEKGEEGNVKGAFYTAFSKAGETATGMHTFL